MGKVHESIDEGLRAFVSQQHVFFVATAPSGAEGHVNCSPKGLDTFRILGPRTVAYLDFTGSGAETIAHLRDNGRIVIMLCAFEGAPKIVRFHGAGRVVLPHDSEFASLRPHFGEQPFGIRSIIVIDVTRISDSCGFGVPHLEFAGERSQLPLWAEKKGVEGLPKYQRERNATSIDGLPALRVEQE